MKGFGFGPMGEGAPWQGRHPGDVWRNGALRGADGQPGGKGTDARGLWGQVGGRRVVHGKKMAVSPQNMAKGAKRRRWDLERLGRRKLGSSSIWYWLHVADSGVRTTQRLSVLEKS